MLNISQVTVGTASSLLVAVPAGPCSVTIANTGGNPMWFTAGTTAAVSNGYAMAAGATPVSFSTPPNSRGAQINVVGTAATVASFILSMVG